MKQRKDEIIKVFLLFPAVPPTKLAIGFQLFKWGEKSQNKNHIQKLLYTHITESGRTAISLLKNITF